MTRRRVTAVVTKVSDGRPEGGLSQSFFQFLSDLDKNNDRDWFVSRKQLFQENVDGPFRGLLDRMKDELMAVVPSIRCDPYKPGTVTRIHRDVRFSSDKRPYKTHLSAMLLHRDQRKGPGMLGYVLCLGIDECYLGAGISQPNPADLDQIRRAIVRAPQEWARLRVGLEGEQRKRIPNGYPGDHPFEADLRRVSFIVRKPFARSAVVKPDFAERVVGAATEFAPLLQFFAHAVGLKWERGPGT